jgi:hypothetical protein
MEEKIITQGQLEGSRKHFQKKYEMNKQSIDYLLSFVKRFKKKSIKLIDKIKTK